MSDLKKQTPEAEALLLMEQIRSDLEAAKGDIACLSEELKLARKLNIATEEKLAQTEEALELYRRMYEDALAQKNHIQELLALSRTEFEIVTNSTAWKMTKPLRLLADATKKLLKKNRVTYRMLRGLRCLQEHGISYTCKRIKLRLNERRVARAATQCSQSDLHAQSKTVFPKKIKFSILVPLYNTPSRFLKEMISSVQKQTYADWELCLADGSDGEHADVESIVKGLAEKDARIRYLKLEKNLGISGNTNACMDMASGDYIALFDHDDLLHPSALFEVMKAICEQDADMIYTDENTFTKEPADAYCPHYKPNFSPDLLRSYNYICHFTVFKRELLERTGGGFRSEFDGSQDYDMILRLTEVAEHIVHIPKILYYWRAHKNSVASDISAKPYTLVAAKKALAEHLKRQGLKGDVLDSAVPSTYRMRYEIQGVPKITIVIPNMDHIDILDQCINSVERRSTYRNYEILIVENNSRKPETFRYYDLIQEIYSNIRVIRWEHEFNYSRINNFAMEHADGEYIILLNNDIEILTPDWMQEMLMYAQRKDVGAVGMMLYYPDDTVQHAGIILGIGGIAGHSHKYYHRGDYGYMSRLSLAQNLTAVTAASLMMRRDVFDEVGGFDDALAVAFNDVDLCMKVRDKGYLIVFTPYAEAYHYESKSRGFEDTKEKQIRFRGEIDYFAAKWKKELQAGDPYYNPNLSLIHEDFSLKKNAD